MHPHDRPDTNQKPSLRHFLGDLERRGELVTFTDEVSPVHEVGAVLSLTDAGPAARLTHVSGSALPIVGNVANSRERLALALGIRSSELAPAIRSAISSPRPIAPQPSGPCQEVDEPDLLAALPVPTFFTGESGPYITAGVIFARDASTGQANMSFARLKVLGPDRAMLGVSPRHHLARLIRQAGSHGTDLPFAVSIGNHPAIMLAACLYLGFGDDELRCAGALLGAPVETVTTSHGIAVPSDSEIVIEAVARADRVVGEGPVSEYHGHYHDYGDGYLVEITRVTRRADAMFQVIVPGLHSEHLLLGAEAIAAGLSWQLKRMSDAVVEVAVPLTGAGRVTAVVSVANLRPGEATRLMMACFTAVPLIKQVVLIDAPLDPWNSDLVEWSRTFKVRPERDIHVFPRSLSDRSDPLAEGGALHKVGIDATAHHQDRDIGWDLARFPAGALDRARAVIAHANGAVCQSPLVEGLPDE